MGPMGHVGWAALLWGAVAGAGPMDVDGAGDCPSAAEVAARLRPLLPAAAADRPGRAELRPLPDGLEIVLRAADGRTLERRVLPDALSCAERADAAAAVLAAWQADLAETPPPLLRLGEPAPPPAARLFTPARPVGARWEVAAALLGSVAGELAGGGLVEVSAAPRRGALGLRLGLLVSAPRDEALGQGSASWTRLAVALGPRLRVEQGPWQLDLEGDLRGGPVFVSGQGYRDPRSETDFDLGLGGGVRLGRRFGAWAPFFDLGLAGWLRRQALRVQGLDETRDLPRIELTLAAGIQVSLEPDR